jgi:urease accessory protein
MHSAAARALPPQAPWRAELELDFERRGAATVLAHRRQHGPLTLQKALYPEGAAVCHCIVLHPPGGIVAGDELALRLRARAGARMLITTPGATKWYRSDGASASQTIGIELAHGACCEWLPQENIVFDGARAASRVNIRLSGDARVFGWEIVCLGRPASGERFDNGELLLGIDIEHEGQLMWRERARLGGGGRLFSSPIGLRGHSVFATAYVAGCDGDAALLESLRDAAAPASAQVGVTALPRMLIARYLGDSAEQAKRYFVELWQRARPALLGRAACAPRIWNT